MTAKNVSLAEQDSALLARRAMQIHRGAARAAVLGVSDGLVSTLCIVLAVAAASKDGHAVLLAGFAGLVAGAISMAAGEWISVISQVDLFKGVLGDLHRMAGHSNGVLRDKLQKDFEETGLSPEVAKTATDKIAKDQDALVKLYARNVIGINTEELGSPITAAVSSFLLFTAGALVALCPWFFVDGAVAAILSIVLTALGGLVVGGYVSKSSGDNIAHGALRQLLIIIFASAVTYGVGHLFGVAVG
jgi:vacuolar iron transporter family protein